jgi:hypothetical protein
MQTSNPLQMNHLPPTTGTLPRKSNTFRRATRRQYASLPF